jgi:hypothetical protein
MDTGQDRTHQQAITSSSATRLRDSHIINNLNKHYFPHSPKRIPSLSPHLQILTPQLQTPLSDTKGLSFIW